MTSRSPPGKHNRSSSRSRTPDPSRNGTLKKSHEDALACLADDRNRGSGADQAAIVTGCEPGIDASISKLRDVFAVLPPDATQALLKMPHAVTWPLRISDRLAAVEDLQEVVNNQLFDLLDDSTRALFEKFADLTAEDASFRYRLFSGVRPESSELLPDLSTVTPHRTMLDFRPRKVSPDVPAAFRSRVR